MTRKFNSLIRCPSCGHLHTAETPFERWVRSRPELESTAGLVRFDLDMLLHRYLTPTDKRGGRDLQGIHFVEVKTYGAEMSASQRDTLGLLNQVLRNRKPNINGERHQRNLLGHTPTATAVSLKLGQRVGLRMFGGHLLVLSGDDPDNSEWMTWHGIKIDKPTLMKLLRLDLDPDPIHGSFLKTDWRRRYGSFAASPPKPDPWLINPQRTT